MISSHYITRFWAEFGYFKYLTVPFLVHFGSISGSLGINIIRLSDIKCTIFDFNGVLPLSLPKSNELQYRASVS